MPAGTDNIKALAPRFMALFDGMPSAHGEYSGVTDVQSNGKILGTIRRTVRTCVTVETWERHLVGESGLGVIPIRSDSTVRFGAIDVDVYDGLDLKALATRLVNMKIPMVVCRSKSGGAHIYCFTSAPIPAVRMVERLSEVAAVLGHGTAERFPKQTSILDDGKDLGSWINCPYFDGLKGLRWAVLPDGDAMEPGEFLDYAEGLQQEPAWFEKPMVVSAEMLQGPPCLQNLIQLGFPQGTRNNGLYNLAVYCRKVDGDNWPALVEELNRKYMNPPLDADEVLGVIKSVKRKSYCYKCSDQPIASHCNAALCRTRKYGVGNGSGAAAEIGPLSKLETIPPIWFLQINGKRLQIETDELYDVNKLQRRAMEAAQTLLPFSSQKSWLPVLSELLVTCESIPAEAEGPNDRFIYHMDQFICGRAQAHEMGELLAGKPFAEPDSNHIAFRLPDLLAHLERVRFRELPPHRITNELKNMGGMSEKVFLKGKQVRIWRIPAPNRQTEGFSVPPSIADEKQGF